MANKKRLIVALVILVGGLILTGCQTHPYSKVENEVFSKLDKLSRKIPKGLVKKGMQRSRCSEDYRYHDPGADVGSLPMSAGKFRTIGYSCGCGDNMLGVWIYHFNDDMAKRLREDKAYLQTLLRLTPNSVVIFDFRRDVPDQYLKASKRRPGLYECYTLTKEYAVVSYQRGGLSSQRIKKDTPWIRYAGEIHEGQTIFELEQSNLCEGKIAPEGQVQRYIDLVERFKETYSFPDYPGEIFSAVKSGNLDKVESLVEIYPELANDTIVGLGTPLHLAAKLGQKEIVKFLIAKGADVNAKFSGLIRSYYDKKAGEITIKKFVGYTPLHFAIANNYKDIAELLIVHGAGVNAKTDDGDTPLDIAVREGHKEIAELLRKHGAVKGD